MLAIRQRARQQGWGILLALWVMGLVPSVALAHATLIRSDPADSALLAEPPHEIRLWFSEPISPEFSSAELLDASSQKVKLAGIQIDRAEPTLMILILPELKPGLYNVRWQVLSEADGHFSQGPLVFGVGEGLSLPPATSVETNIFPLLPEVWLRWLNFGLLLIQVGTIAAAYLILSFRNIPASLPDSVILAHRRSLALALLCSGLAILVGLGLLGWQVKSSLTMLPEEASISGVSWQVLSRTRWGSLWIARQALLLFLAGLLFRAYRAPHPASQTGEAKGFPSLAVSGLVLGLLLVQACTSHAAAVQPQPLLAIVVDFLHLLAGGIWIGGLFALGISLWLLRSQTQPEWIKACWRAFGRVAVPSTLILVATGLYSTGRQVASLDALLGTLYGQTLQVKVGLMGAAGLVGLTNALLLHPRLIPSWRPLYRRSISPRYLPRLIFVEAGLAALILLAASLLTTIPTARGAEFEVAPEEISTDLSQSVEDMIISFSAKPNRPGQNIFTVRAVSTRRPPPAEMMRVILRFTPPDRLAGRVSASMVEIEPGLYQLGGSHLSLAGPWRVQVVARRAGIEDTIAEFTWVVAPPGSARPVMISNRALAPWLTLLAALIILIAPFAAALVWPDSRLIRLWQKRKDRGRNHLRAETPPIWDGQNLVKDKNCP